MRHITTYDMYNHMLPVNWTKLSRKCIETLKSLKCLILKLAQAYYTNIPRGLWQLKTIARSTDMEQLLSI